MSQNAFEIGAPIPTINAAVESRLLSALRAERQVAGETLRDATVSTYSGNRQELIDAARDALYASKITAYAQGLAMIGIASREYEYDLHPGDIAKIWRASCIIRADLLGEITQAYHRDQTLVNLLIDPTFADAVRSRAAAWRRVVSTGAQLGIPMLAMTSALSYFDAYRSPELPQNLTQAKRDYFGSHTYQRNDKGPNAPFIHTDWMNM
jgi:6-phosphogluconate dehydrogenase